MYFKICTIKYKFPAAFGAYIYVYTYFSSITHILQSGLREGAPSGEKREDMEDVRRDAPRLIKVEELGEDGESKRISKKERTLLTLCIIYRLPRPELFIACKVSKSRRNIRS